MPLEFKPKLSKIVELLLHLAAKRPDADKYQAVKFLYLADREHLQRYGRPITYDNYYALWYGPVASKALDLLQLDQDVLAEADITELPFRTEIAKTANGTDTTYIREPYRKANVDFFSKTDLAVFDEIVAEYGNYTFKQLMDLTHDHRGYKIAWQSRGNAKRAPMAYEDMIDDEARRSALVEDYSQVAARM